MSQQTTMPAYTCEVCGLAITEVGQGAVAYPDPPAGGSLTVHKGRCHDEAEARLGSRPGGGWDELYDAHAARGAAAGITVRETVRREARWSIALTPAQLDELDDRLDGLLEWLRDHGVVSPVLG